MRKLLVAEMERLRRKMVEQRDPEIWEYMGIGPCAREKLRTLPEETAFWLGIFEGAGLPSRAPRLLCSNPGFRNMIASESQSADRLNKGAVELLKALLPSGAFTPRVAEQPLFSQRKEEAGITHWLGLFEISPGCLAILGSSTTDAKNTLDSNLAEQARTEERLRLYAKILGNTSEAILVLTADGKVVDINPALLELSGYSEGDAVGQANDFLESFFPDREAFSLMWSKLNEEGEWQGELCGRRRSGEDCPVWATINELRDSREQLSHRVFIFSDISELKRTEERLEFLAYYDTVTGLPNRALLQDRLGQALLHAKRNREIVALCVVDLDHFKHVNDTLGHNIGDKVLLQVAHRLSSSVRRSDTVARLLGDEFVIVLTSLDGLRGIAKVVTKLMESFSTSVELEDCEVLVTASVGIAVYPSDAEDADDLLKCADIAMYHAKRVGRNNYQFYSSEMTRRTLQQMSMIADLRHAQAQCELELFYQPQISCSTGKIMGVEALLRWRSTKYGFVLPGDFIPLAEESGLIVPIGKWVLRRACQQVKRWHEKGYENLRVAVNLSCLQFKQEDLVVLVSQVLEETGLNGELLELEITESAILQDMEAAVGSLHELKKMGIRIALDDFGTGYSSLNHLRHFPIDTLKIDRSFIRELNGDADNAAIVSALISFGHNLKLRVIAEGIETPKHMEFLSEQECDEVQGYFFSKAVCPEDVSSLLGREHFWPSQPS